MRFIIASVALIAVMLTVGLGGVWQPAEAQVLPATAPDSAPILPDELSPEVIDAMMARLTDAEIRALLRDELVRRAEAEAAADAEPSTMQTLMKIEDRLTEMAERIQARTARWVVAIANISNREERVRERLSLATSGVGGMIAAAIAVAVAGLLAAAAVARMTRPWRAWLAKPARSHYWDKVVRTLALGITEFLAIIAFVIATRLTAPLVSGPLGPLADYVWIYHAGVSYSWTAIVVFRRAFAPDAPEIRIAPLTDDMAKRLHAVLRRAVQIGAAGWLIAGFSPTLGFGFPPAMVTVAASGTLVAILLFIGLARSTNDVRKATAMTFGGFADTPFGKVAVAGAPTLLGIYLAGAWGYWLAHWLERGQHRLEGPAGTMIVYLVLPIFDRMGRELITSCIRTQSEMSQRLRNVFFGAWRILVGFCAVLVVAGLWGIDLLALTHGPNAPTWASTAFDIVVTLLVGYLIWRLISAALHTEKRVSDASEDVDPSSVPAASRLNTLTPLFRNTLLAFLLIVVAMIVLSGIGVDIGPLIASAGIIGIAIGLGAQSLVRDVLSGVFFLIDDAFRVGEYIELDADTRGEVESISVRSMQIRHHRGPVITLPFGELKQIMNHNRDWVIYKMSFRMEPDTDPQKFKKLVKGVGKEFLEHPDHGPKFIEPVKSQGVYYVDDDSALVMRVKFKCKPRAQFVLRREIYHRLRELFAENGMQLARRKVEVVGAESTDALADSAASAAAMPRPPAPA